MKTKKGFTIVELTLSIVFISVLLIGIASLVIRMTAIYQKGLTLRAVNASGQQIIEDIERAVNGASYLVDITKADANGDGYIDDNESKAAMQTYFYEAVNTDTGAQKYGALCISNYTYVWNTPESLNNDYGGVWINDQRYRFARIPDPSHMQCNKDITDTIANLDGDEEVRISINASTEPIELINADEIDLAIYSFKITPATQSIRTKQAFISASFILATLRGDVNIMSNGDFCGGGTESAEFINDEFNYCAVNKFNFSMRTGGNANREG